MPDDGDKRFTWKDLHAYLERETSRFEGVSRELEAIRLLLAGQKIDLRQIPAKEGGRSRSRVKRSIKLLLRQHAGVQSQDDVYWIPELCTEAT